MNQYLPTHCGLFLSCDEFIKDISIKIDYLHLKYNGLFLYSKSSYSLIPAIIIVRINARDYCHIHEIRHVTIK